MEQLKAELNEAQNQLIAAQKHKQDALLLLRDGLRKGETLCSISVQLLLFGISSLNNLLYLKYIF